MDLDERKQMVLAVIVEDYIAQGEPVGSKTVALKFDNAFSSATIRNEMSALTQMGLIEQPHTSAGRVPSWNGYQFYIENLMPQKKLSPKARQRIESFFTSNLLVENRDALMEKATEALSVLTNYASVLTTPESRMHIYAHVELMPAQKRMVIVLFLTTSGGVDHRMARMLTDLNKEECGELAFRINERLQGIPVDQVKAEHFRDLGASFDPIYTAVEGMAEHQSGGELILVGQMNLFSYEELARRPQQVLSFLKEDRLRELMEAAKDQAAVVAKEGGDAGQGPQLGLIAAKYHAGDGSLGTIGIIGPARINYSEMVPYVQYFAKMMGEVMDYLSDPEWPPKKNEKDLP